MEWTKTQYKKQRDVWVPWLEDQYLKYFTKDNKASYATKDNLAKTKVTGDDRVDKVQDDVNNVAASQVGQGGLGQPIGDLVSKEGVNRAERSGKDEEGNIAPGTTAGNPVTESIKDGAAGTSEAASEAATKTTEGAKNAGGYFGGWFGGASKK